MAHKLCKGQWPLFPTLNIIVLIYSSVDILSRKYPSAATRKSKVNARVEYAS